MPPRRIFSKLANTRSMRLIEGQRTIYLYNSFFLFSPVIRVIYRTHVRSRSQRKRFDRSIFSRSKLFFSTRKIIPYVSLDPTVALESRRSGRGKIGDALCIADTCEAKWVGIHPIPCNIIQGDDASLDIEHRKCLISE